MFTIEKKNKYLRMVTDYPIDTTYLFYKPKTNFRNLQAIMMDMDGSSTDTEKLVLETVRQVFGVELKNKNFQFAKADYPHIIGDSKTNHFLYLIKTYGLRKEDVRQYIANYYVKYHQLLQQIIKGKIRQQLIEPMPGLKEFLLWAKSQRIKIGLVTSSIRKEVDMIMPVVFKGMELNIPHDELYDAIVTADDVGEPFLKPHPNLYILARERLGAKEEQCIAIEDSSPGIAAARVSGVSVFAVPHRHTTSHQFELANLGVAQKGLVDILKFLKRETKFK